ncbi:MAG: hypothetical protein ACW98X_21670, partial [Promethearchaeota archaeon]
MSIQNITLMTLDMILTGYNCKLCVISAVNKNWNGCLKLEWDLESFYDKNKQLYIFKQSQKQHSIVINQLDNEMYACATQYNFVVDYHSDWRHYNADWENCWYAYRCCQFFYDHVYKMYT